MNAQLKESTPMIHIENIHIHLPTSQQVDAVILPFNRASEKHSSERFELSTDGSYVHDHKLGLIWAAVESEKEYNFADAEKYAAEFRLGDWNDWRLPEESELQSLRDLSRYNPCIDVSVFKSNAGYVWTKTPYAANTSYAFAVNFLDGRVYNYSRGSRCFVRPVRVARQ